MAKRYAEQIAGVISCWDRVVIQGTLTTVCHPNGTSRYLTARKIKIFDFWELAKPLTDEIRANAERVADAAWLEIDSIRKKNFRKEDRIQEVIRERDNYPGLVWVFSALEPCSTYRPWRDAATGPCDLRIKDGKCLHDSFYFLDEELGLCYLRMPTWCPFRLQFYFNGHNWLVDCLRGRRDGRRERRPAPAKKSIYSLWGRCGSCWRPPMAAIWSSSRRSRIGAPAAGDRAS